jgi:succinate-acetate transporter protein
LPIFRSDENKLPLVVWIRLTKAGGVVGIITAMIAYYIGVSEMLDAEANPIVVLPRGVLE